MTKLPQFSLAFIHPRYWLSWAGIAALWCTVQLPYPLLLKQVTGLDVWPCACFHAAWRSPDEILSFVFLI